MNIPKEAIAKAKEGGWDDYETMNGFVVSADEEPNIAALDPLFWQALGKSLGWPKHEPTKDSSSVGITEWHHFAMSFYNLILTNGDTDKFWTDLLANK